MKKHFLFGKHAINVYKTKGINSVAEISPNGYELFTWVDNHSNPEKLMDAFIPWGDYVEIKEDEIKYINLKNNVSKWREFINTTIFAEDLNDGQLLDYLMENFQIPKPRIKFDLYASDYVLFSHAREEFERFSDGDIAIYGVKEDAILHSKGTDYLPISCTDLSEENKEILLTQINRIEHD